MVTDMFSDGSWWSMMPRDGMFNDVIIVDRLHWLVMFPVPFCTNWSAQQLHSANPWISWHSQYRHSGGANETVRVLSIAFFFTLLTIILMNNSNEPYMIARFAGSPWPPCCGWIFTCGSQHLVLPLLGKPMSWESWPPVADPLHWINR